MDILEDRQGEAGFVIVVNSGDHYKQRKDIRGSELSDTKVEGGGEQKR